MINLSSIGHVLLRVADEEASKRFYRDVLGFRIAEQDPEHGGVFMTLGDGFHTIDIAQHPAPREAPMPRHGQLGLAHIAFKVASTRHCATLTLICLTTASKSNAPPITSASAAFISPIQTATAWKSITRCRGHCTCSRTAAATRTKCCR